MIETRLAFARDALPALLADLFPRGRGAEIGVWNGDYSEALLRGWQPGEFFAVDPWREYPQHDYFDPTNAPQLEMDARYDRTCQRLAGFAGCHVLRKTSFQAARDFPDEHFDCVYIDAAHDYKSVLIDLVTWWPKIRPGGILAGHDYFLYQAANHRIEVPTAVDEFFAHVPQVALAITNDDPPTWLARKGAPLPERRIDRTDLFPCEYRGEVAGQDTCVLCGPDKGLPVNVYKCFWHGACTVHAAGIRWDGPASALLPVCLSCEERT